LHHHGGVDGAAAVVLVGDVLGAGHGAVGAVRPAAGAHVGAEQAAEAAGLGGVVHATVVEVDRVLAQVVDARAVVVVVRRRLRVQQALHAEAGGEQVVGDAVVVLDVDLAGHEGRTDVADI